MVGTAHPAAAPKRGRRRAHAPRAVAWTAKLALLCCLGSPCWLALLPGGCHPAGPAAGDGRPGLAPATSAERAAARAARAARSKALAEQGDQPPPPPEAPEDLPPPPPPPEPSATAVASAAPAEPQDAGTPEAGSDAAVASADAGPPSPDALCQQLCARAMACALEMLEGSGPGLPPEIADRMREQMKASEERCREECTSKLEASEDRIARAKQCVAEEDCETFLDCMREVLNE